MESTYQQVNNIRIELQAEIHTRPDSALLSLGFSHDSLL